MSEIGNTKLDSEEVLEEMVSLLHCYSMKMYSKRKNKLINADVNGAYNIMRKVFSDVFANGVSGVGLHPVRVNII